MSVIKFYRGEIPNNEGDYIHDIMTWNTGHLEMDHDYIQWLFPLEEPSNFNEGAPVVTLEDITEFRRSAELQQKFIESFSKILLFFGFVLENGEIRVQIDGEYHKDAARIFRQFNHNMLRITRVLRSLKIFGFEDESEKFLEALKVYKSNVSENTWNYWQDAVDLPTNNYKKVEQLLIELHELMLQQDKVEKQLSKVFVEHHEIEKHQDLIRDEMDLPVRCLSPKENQKLREKSEQLYAENKCSSDEE